MDSVNENVDSSNRPDAFVEITKVSDLGKTDRDCPNASVLDDRYHREARRAGLRALQGNARMFCRIFLPISIISVWMFGLYAVFSWLIPHVLCKRSAQDLSVRPHHGLNWYCCFGTGCMLIIVVFIQHSRGHLLEYISVCTITMWTIAPCQ